MGPLLSAILLMTAPRVDTAEAYAHAIGCAAGETLLADLLGGDSAAAPDSASVDALRAIADGWRQTARRLAAPGAMPDRDLAQSRADLVRVLGAVRDPAAFADRLDTRLEGCAPAIAGQPA